MRTASTIAPTRASTLLDGAQVAPGHEARTRGPPRRGARGARSGTRASSSTRSRRTDRARRVLSSWMRVVSMPSGQLRFHSENLVLLAKSAVMPPAALTGVKTDSMRVPGGRLHGRRPAPVVVPGHAVAAGRGLDAPAGHHAGVVGQRDGLLVLGARVERRRAGRHEVVKVGRAGPGRAAERVGVEPVDRDRQTESIGVVGEPAVLGRRGRRRAPGRGGTRATRMAAAGEEGGDAMTMVTRRP